MATQKNDHITFASFLWKDKARQRSYSFDVEHVLILRSMLQRNCTLGHELAVITNSEAIAGRLAKEDVRCVPLDESKHVPGTCAVKLMARRPDIGGILGRRIALLDLDIVITGNVDEIFSRADPCVFYRNPNYEAGGRRAFYQGSIQLFTAGQHSFLYTEFDPNVTPALASRRFGGMEQAWISERLDWNEPYWDASHGIYGAGRIFRDKQDNGVVAELPENAKIVVCPGDRAPWQEEMQKSHPWIVEHYR